MWRTLKIFLLLTSCEMIKSGNVSIVLFDGLCKRSDDDLNNLIKSELTLENNFIFTQVCVNEYNNIEAVIKSDGVDIFIGPMNLKNDKTYLKFADIFNKPYISPNGIDRHKGGDIIWSLGVNYQRLTTALGIVLTHFKWRQVLLITEERTEYVTFGNEMFIELVNDGFRPSIEYVRQDFTDTDIETMLLRITNHQKGRLC